MTKKCLGCGILMQSTNEKKLGYTDPSIIEAADYCQRCFQIKNYNNYQIVSTNNNDYLKVLTKINKTNDLVLYVVDIFNIDQNILNIKNIISNKMILVFNKRDILPKSVSANKLLEYFKKYNIDIIDTIIISAYKNYGFDKLYSLIKKHKISNDIYLIGNTNAGKSTIINKFIQNYAQNNKMVVTSQYRSTTLDMIKIKINDEFTLIDTPGLLDDGNISTYVDSDMLKKITPKKEIKPITFQINGKSSFLIDNLVRIDYLANNSNSMTIYVSNELKIDRINSDSNKRLNNLKEYYFELSSDQDIVMNGLGFIKFVKGGKISIKTFDKVSIYKRDNLI